jgi:hypothetical protein
VKRLFSTLWLTAAAGLLLLAPVAAAPAQDLKPLAVVSIAPVDKLLGDVDYLTTAGGAADAGRLVTLILGPYIDGIDRTKPAGAYVTLDGDKPVAVAFIPTKDLVKIQATLRDQLGEPKDVGDGIQQMGDAQVFLKLVGGYTFVAQDQAHLATLPKDPALLLGGLDKTYSVAAKFTVKNVPQMYKDQMVEEMKKGFDSAPIADDADPAQKELQEKLSRNALDQMIRLVNESNEITLGWAVDSASKSTYIDVLYTALDGTKLAKQMAALKNAKTDFAGFLLPSAAFNALSTSTTTDKEEIGQTLALIDGFHAQAIKQLEEEELDEDEQEAAEDLIDSVVEVISATIEEGKFDGGAVALADDKSLTFVAGGHIVDAADLEKALKEAIAFAQKKHPEEFEGKDIMFDSGKHGGIRFHTLKLPVDDEKAQKAFGEKMTVIIGIGDDTAYVAFGSKALETVKKVIDLSAADAGKSVLPAQATIALGPILKFVDSIDSNAMTTQLLAAAEKAKGNDRLSMNVTSIPNGEKIRIQLEEGVLQIIGAGAKAAQSAQGGGF